MFITNYELVYGKQKTNSSSQNTPSPAEYKTVSSSTAEIDSPIPEQQHNAMQDAVGFIKSDNTKQKLGALSSKLKNVAGAAASTASGLAKSAVGTAKSEETSSKITSFKEKAQSAVGGIGSSVSGVGNKASKLLTSHKNNGVTLSDALVSDNYNEDTINKVSNIPIFQEEPYHSQTKQTYNYSPTNENSSKKPIIIGIIAGLSVCAVFTAGLLGGQHLMKNNKNNNTSDNNDIPVQVTDSQQTKESGTSPPVKTTVVKTEIFTETPTEVVTEFELPDKNEDSDSHSSQTLFSDNINDYPLYLERIQYIVSLINQGCNWGEFIQKELSIHYYNENASDFLNNCGYALYDLNDDGFPELILAQKNDTKVIEIYTVYDNQLVNLCCSQERNVYFLCENNVISSAGSSGASTGGIAYFAYSGGNELTNLVTLSYEFNENGEKTFYKNQEQIAQNEAEKILNSYNEITLNTTAISNIPNSNNSNNTRKEYTFEEIKSKAGYDFNFYAYSGPYTIVNTERDPLNLRAAPSTNADIITKIPKGTYVTAHAGNGEWSLISYYNEEDDILYYGFASSQYLY